MDAAWGAALAQRLGESADKVSGHLRPLRICNLVREQPRGKQHRYKCTPGRVRLDRQPGGGFALSPSPATLTVEGAASAQETNGSE